MSRNGVSPARMSGRVLSTAQPHLRATPEPALYAEHVTADGRRAFIAYRVLDALAALERDEHPIETGGLLFGGFFTDGEHPCVVVNEFEPPRRGEVIGTAATVTITSAGSDRMIERAWRRDPLLCPVGWGHTHPRFEAYFSRTDRDEQQRWREPASVGLVISGLTDPRHRYHVFLGPSSSATRPVPALSSVYEEREPRAGGREPPRSRRVVVREPPLPRVFVAILLAAVLACTVLSSLAWREASTAHTVASRALVAERSAATAERIAERARRTAERARRAALDASMAAFVANERAGADQGAPRGSFTGPPLPVTIGRP